jgi:hypothetical protein
LAIADDETTKDFSLIFIANYNRAVACTKFSFLGSGRYCQAGTASHYFAIQNFPKISAARPAGRGPGPPFGARHLKQNGRAP